MRQNLWYDVVWVSLIFGAATGLIAAGWIG